MCDDMTAWERDEEYLYAMCDKLGRRLSEEQVHHFCETVAYRVKAGIPQDMARRVMLREVLT